MKAWSYSGVTKYETCPRQYYEVKVVKTVIEPPTEATDWGKKVHTAFEERIKDGTALPEGMTQWEPLAARLAAMPGTKLTEHPVALDRSFKPTEWDSAWTRGVIDLLVLGETSAVVVDYKTGKRRPTDQLLLYALYVFALFPNIQKVTTGFAWLRDKKIDTEVVMRSEMSELWGKFLERVARLESAHDRESWPERPSGLCNGWCPVSQCKFHKAKK